MPPGLTFYVLPTQCFYVFCVELRKKLGGLYATPNINWMVKSRRMRWTWHVECMVYTGFWWGNIRERNYLEDPGIDGKIILRRIFRAWTGSSWLSTGAGGGHL